MKQCCVSFESTIEANGRQAAEQLRVCRLGRLKPREEPGRPLCANGEMDVLFKDVRFNVRVGRRRERLELLHGISGYAKSGEVLAVMGPSGGGKTSLLNILAHRVTEGDTSGEITYGGFPWDRKTRTEIGFVTQDDLMFETLTVMETLKFTAKVRLPKSLGRDAVRDRVVEVLQSFNLEKAADTYIGDGLNKKGISGGERKRVAIANEILVDPKVIFLDEPTSGLDSSMALTVVKLLKELARNGKTVIMSIHQPSSQIFALFDRLLLLRAGEAVYYGFANETVKHFAAAGYSCPFGYNPADFFMALITDVEDGEPEHQPDDVLDALNARWGPTDAIDVVVGNYEPTKSAVERHKKAKKWPTSWWTQFCALTRRSVKQRRGSLLDGLLIFKVGAMVFLFSALWFRMRPVETSLMDRLGCLYFITVFWAMSSVLSTASTFASEYHIIRKENANSSYRLSAYFMSKSLVDVPYDIIYPFIFGVIVYWLTGMAPDFKKFVIFLIVHVSHVINAYSVGLAASTITLNTRKAIVLASVYTLASVLLAGFYANDRNLNKVALAFQYASYIRYSYSALVLNEFEGRTYACEPPATDFRIYGCPIEAEAVLTVMPVERIGVMGNLAVIWGLIVLYRLIAFFFLYFVNRKHQNT
mmetsp:Transcript_12998/g.40025  ORF Transcript_12998/g.40025 Transcript_12998/m.40025 type:complete len:644 (+) Transcript_12998:133-2064(+)